MKTSNPNPLKSNILHLFISNFISLIATLGTGFLLPKFLSIESYSEIKLFQLYLTYVGILHLGFADGIYLKNGGKSLKTINHSELNSEYRTFKFFQFLVSLTLSVVALLFKNYIFFFCALTILPINSSSFIRSLYQAIGEFKSYAKFTNLNTLLIFVINLFLLFVIKTNQSLLFISLYAFVYFFYWFIIEFHYHRIFAKSKPKIQKRHLIENVRSGFFLMTGNFCSIMLTSIDRLFVNNFINTLAFAHYSFAVSIENLLTVFITPISTVLYNYFHHHNSTSDIIKAKRLTLIFASLLISLFFPAKFIVQIFLPNFSPSLSILAILFLSQFFSIIVRIIHVNLYKSTKTQFKYFKNLTKVIFLSIILNLLAVLIFKSPDLIAFATLLSNLFWLIISEIDFKKYRFKLPDYIFTFSIILTFAILSITPLPLISFMVYLIIVLLISIILMPDVFKTFFKIFHKSS